MAFTYGLTSGTNGSGANDFHATEDAGGRNAGNSYGKAEFGIEDLFNSASGDTFSVSGTLDLPSSNDANGFNNIGGGPGGPYTIFVGGVNTPVLGGGRNDRPQFQVGGNADLTLEFGAVTLSGAGKTTVDGAACVRPLGSTVAVIFNGTTIDGYDVVKTAAQEDGGLFYTIIDAVFEFTNTSITNYTYDSGSLVSTITQAPGLYSAIAGIIVNGLTLDEIDITLSNTTNGSGGQFFRLKRSSTINNLNVDNYAAASTAAHTGQLRGLMSFNPIVELAQVLTVNGGTLANIALSGPATAGASSMQAWGYTLAGDVEALMNISNVTMIGCTKVGGSNAQGGLFLAAGRVTAAEDDSRRVISTNCTITDCHGSFGAGGFATGGGDMTIIAGLIEGCTDGNNDTGDEGVPNGVAVYKGGTGNLTLLATWMIRNSALNSDKEGQVLYSHYNPSSGGTIDHGPVTTIIGGGIRETASGNYVAYISSNEAGGFEHDALIEDYVLDNDGLKELMLNAALNGVLNVTIRNTQIKGYDGPADQVETAYTDTTQLFGSLLIRAVTGGTVNLTLINVTDILGSPTLTTPYSIINTATGTSGSVDLGDNWAGASSYVITGLPTGAVQVGSTGVVNYTVTTVERSFVRVIATNSNGSAQASFNWNVYSAAAVNEITRNTTLQAIVTKLTP